MITARTIMHDGLSPESKVHVPPHLQPLLVVEERADYLHAPGCCVSCTSRRLSWRRRPRRDEEVDGVDYVFVSKQVFSGWVAQGTMLEHAIVYGDYKVRTTFCLRCSCLHNPLTPMMV